MSERSDGTRSHGFLMGNLVVVGSILLIFLLMMKLSIVAHLNITTARAIAATSDKGALLAGILVGSLPSSAEVLFGTASLVVISRAVALDAEEHIFAIFLCTLTVAIATILSSWAFVILNTIFTSWVVYVYRISSYSEHSGGQEGPTRTQVIPRHGFRRGLQVALVAFIVGNAFQMLLNDEPPLPTMIIYPATSAPFTGYLLKDDGAHVWILHHNTRQVEVKPVSELTERSCQVPPHRGIVGFWFYSGPIQLYGRRFQSSGYPSCP